MEVTAVGRRDANTAIVEVKWKDPSSSQWIVALVHVAASPEEIPAPAPATGAGLREVSEVPYKIKLQAIENAQNLALTFGQAPSSIEKPHA